MNKTGRKLLTHADGSLFTPEERRERKLAQVKLWQKNHPGYKYDKTRPVEISKATLYMIKNALRSCGFKSASQVRILAEELGVSNTFTNQPEEVLSEK